MITNGNDERLEDVLSEMEVSDCDHLEALASRLRCIIAEERAARLEDALAHMLRYEGLVNAAFADYKLQLKAASGGCEKLKPPPMKGRLEGAQQ